MFENVFGISINLFTLINNQTFEYAVQHINWAHRGQDKINKYPVMAILAFCVKRKINRDRGVTRQTYSV